MYSLHAPGEAQVDFGKIPVIKSDGREVNFSYLVVSFPCSNAGFMQLCRFETKECLCEALIKIFENLGGVPPRILFDIVN
jgi:hypothetical protein